MTDNPDFDAVQLETLTEMLGPSRWEPSNDLKPVIAREAARYCRAAGAPLTIDILSLTAAVFTQGLNVGYSYARLNGDD